MSIFEKATRKKLRFQTTKGNASVEDLWDLSLPDLDKMAILINRKLKEETEESFLAKQKKNPKNETLELELDILKHIIQVRLAEKEARVEKAKEQEELAMLEVLLEDKRKEELKGMSNDEIRERIKKLKGE